MSAPRLTLALRELGHIAICRPGKAGAGATSTGGVNAVKSVFRFVEPVEITLHVAQLAHAAVGLRPVGDRPRRDLATQRIGIRRTGRIRVTEWSVAGAWPPVRVHVSGADSPQREAVRAAVGDAESIALGNRVAALIAVRGIAGPRRAWQMDMDVLRRPPRPRRYRNYRVASGDPPGQRVDRIGEKGAGSGADRLDLIVHPPPP